MRSNRKAVEAEIAAIMRRKNAAAGAVVEGAVKRRTPVGTPESTGIEKYRGGRLRSSITHDPDENGVRVGTNVKYAPYVHNGTYDYKVEEWDESGFGDSFTAAEDSNEDGKGMKPRPFLVEGLLASKEELRRIYGA